MPAEYMQLQSSKLCKNKNILYIRSIVVVGETLENVSLFFCYFLLFFYKCCYAFSLPSLLNREIHEKGSGDVVSAVCYTIYTIYLSLFTQTAETTSYEPFS